MQVSVEVWWTMNGSKLELTDWKIAAIDQCLQLHSTQNRIELV